MTLQRSDIGWFHRNRIELDQGPWIADWNRLVGHREEEWQVSHTQRVNTAIKFTAISTNSTAHLTPV